MKTKYLLAFVLLFALLISCKKVDTSKDSFELNGIDKIHKVKSWYNNQNGTYLNVSRGNQIPMGSPNWENTHWYFYEEKSVCIIPMVITSDSTTSLNINQFAIIELNLGEEIINAEYAYLLLDETDSTNFTQMDLENLEPEAFDLTNIPSGLSSWIIKYDFNRDFVLSKFLSNGAASDCDIKLNSIAYEKVPQAECSAPVCIDWYYQIWLNGVLIYEEYLFRTCGCDSYEGGSGGGGSGSSTSCSLTESEGKDFLQTIQHEEMHESYYTLGMLILDENSQRIRQNKIYHWPFYKCNYGLNYFTEWSASFPGIRVRENTTSPWKWETISYGGISRIAGQPLPCTETTVTGSASVLIQQGETEAFATLTYTSITTLTCVFNITVNGDPKTSTMSQTIPAED